mmetsp:Transcript_37338/g.120331  ORF Transcript_37338/g.120331 Transcript_37338/m.120331 type:complete len:252 (+) Transcript_37338:306-1061(+)
MARTSASAYQHRCSNARACGGGSPRSAPPGSGPRRVSRARPSRSSPPRRGGWVGGGNEGIGVRPRKGGASASASASHSSDRAAKLGCSSGGAPRPRAALASWFQPPRSLRWRAVSKCSLRRSSASQYVASSSRFTAAVLSGDLAAISEASRRASARGSSARRVTRPSWSASSPSKMRPVMISSVATSFGTSSGRTTVAPMSGMMPHLASIRENLHPGVAMRMSAPSAIWKPPPRQTPWVAAMTGAGTRRHR